MEPRPQVYQKIKPNKNSQKELTKEEHTHFGNILISQALENECPIVLLNIQPLPNSRKGEKNFDIPHLITDKKFDQLGLTDIRRHCPSLIDDVRIPQIFSFHFMSQQLELISACNQHALL